jgi:hypothetical protein
VKRNVDGWEVRCVTEMEPYPEPRSRDYLRGVVDAGVSAVPVIGSPIEILMNTVIAPSITKRRDAWLRNVGGDA